MKTAENGRPAWVAFAEFSADVVLLDVTLPDTTGIDLLAQFKMYSERAAVVGLRIPLRKVIAIPADSRPTCERRHSPPTRARTSVAPPWLRTICCTVASSRPDPPRCFAKSSEAGKGTSFRIVLPGAAAPADDPAAAAVTSPPGTVRRVLLVEDDAHVAVGLTQALAANGMHVDVVHTGARVLHAVRTFTPEVVVLDIRLPDANGFDVYREIAAAWPDLPVIFSTGHADEFDLEAAEPLKHRHVELLRKPYPTEALIAAMDRVTAHNPN